jgi:hypothetical protein
LFQCLQRADVYNKWNAEGFATRAELFSPDPDDPPARGGRLATGDDAGELDDGWACRSFKRRRISSTRSSGKQGFVTNASHPARRAPSA